MSATGGLRRLAAPIFLWMLAAPNEAAAQYNAFAPEAENDAARLVAMLKTTFEGEAGERLGAGIVVAMMGDVLYIATANHNVRWGDARIASLQIFLNGDERKPLPGTVLPRFDAALDLAVVAVTISGGLATTAADLPFERLGNAASLKRGDQVSLLGHPNGHAWEMALYPDRLSGTRDERLLFQSTFIASGHSGGALLDKHLDVVGLIRSDQPPYGEAVKIDEVLKRVAAWGYPVQLGHDLRKPRFVQVAAAESHACAVTANGEAYCFGSAMGGGALGHGTDAPSDRLRRVLGGHRFKQVGVGRDHTCGLATDGHAWCWGSNVFGELGTGTPVDARDETRIPVAVAGGHRFTDLSVGSFNSCGLAADGSAWCWADHDRRVREPRRIRSDVRLTSVYASQQDACGLTDAGQLYCWTLNSLVTERPKEPTLSFVTPVLRKFAMADDTGFFGCGLVGHAAHCWGRNYHGQLGDGRGGVDASSASNSESPVPVSGTHAFEELSIGRDYGCGLEQGGKAWCWGENIDGQLGDGTTVPRNAPVAVAGGLKFSALSAGIEMSCGVVSGDVYCWGKISGRTVTEPTRIPVHGE